MTAPDASELDDNRVGRRRRGDPSCVIMWSRAVPVRGSRRRQFPLAARIAGLSRLSSAVSFRDVFGQSGVSASPGRARIQPTWRGALSRCPTTGPAAARARMGPASGESLRVWARPSRRFPFCTPPRTSPRPAQEGLRRRDPARRVAHPGELIDRHLVDLPEGAREGIADRTKIIGLAFSKAVQKLASARRSALGTAVGRPEPVLLGVAHDRDLAAELVVQALCEVGGAVRAAVVHHQDVGIGYRGPHLAEHVVDVLGLVESGHHDEGTVHGRRC